MRTLVLSMAMGMLIVSAAAASDAGDNIPAACKEVQTCGAPDCCAHCGCHACCEKYCRVVCEMKEVKKTVWVVKCEDFCAPLPGCPLQCHECCKSCDKEGCQTANCEGCDKCCNPCASLEDRCYVPPKCGKVREKKVLEKKEIVCKIPTYKCVVVYACANCGQKACEEKTEARDPAAPAPPPAPKTTYISSEPPIISASYLR